MTHFKGPDKYPVATEVYHLMFQGTLEDLGKARYGLFSHSSPLKPRLRPCIGGTPWGSPIAQHQRIESELTEDMLGHLVRS